MPCAFQGKRLPTAPGCGLKCNMRRGPDQDSGFDERLRESIKVARAMGREDDRGTALLSRARKPMTLGERAAQGR
jgi:hypothetical protein